jgi:cyclophilin family peptidyl-prolyl cis-trans isomerase
MFDRQRGRLLGKTCKPHLESLESRRLLDASLQPIPNLNVPVTVGSQVPLLAGAGAPNQVYTVTTSNDNIQAAIAQGKFMTVNVTHASSGGTDPAFTGSLTFQLFEDLTPLTASKIEQLVAGGFYTNRNFHRVSPFFPGPTDYIVQGGSVNGDGTGQVPYAGFPFQDEFNLQLVYDGMGQLAMANQFGNAGFDTNDSQFFVTDPGQPRFLDFSNPIFGQLVSGQETLDLMTQVAVQPAFTGENPPTMPVSPIIITSATLSDVNPNGVLHINSANSVTPGVTDVTVTATDPVTNTTASQTFQVTAVPNNDADGNPINERAILGLVDPNPVIGANQTYTVQLNGADATPGDTLTYTVQGGLTADRSAFVPIQNATAAVSDTGLLTVTPTAGFTGTIKLLVGVRDQIDRSGTGNINSPRNFNMHNITLQVTNQFAGVRVLNSNLIITPPPRTDKVPNTVSVDESNGVLLVTMNGVVNPIQPQSLSIDRIIIFGAKASDQIQVQDTVDPAILVTLDGGHGGTNFLKAGLSDTREHGWFGKNTLIGGPGNDALIGRRGHVRFVDSDGSDQLFAGVIPVLQHRSTHHVKARVHKITHPSGTFYKFVNGHLLPRSVANRIIHHQQVQAARAARHTTT